MYSKLAILLLVTVGMAQCGFLNYTPNSSYGQQSSYGNSNNGYPASSSINRQDTTNGHRIFGVARSYHYGTFNPRYGGGYDGNNFRNNNGYSNNNLYGASNNNGGYGYNLNNNQGSSNTPNTGFNGNLNGNNLNRAGNYGYGNGYGYNTYGYGSTSNNGQGQINSSYRSNGNY
ncbi:insoluble matrix shell protein 4-like [Onthophagus taurus]|uniref:insoluble matrix shell protein 4-like n=1 Tax=Onthophagus taurus TaxID=166361 RepID=UPI0039BE812E